MYVCVVLVIFVIVECGLFFGYIMCQVMGLECVMMYVVQYLQELLVELIICFSLLLVLVLDILVEKYYLYIEKDLEDFSELVYIVKCGEVQQCLWIFDIIVIVVFLLGLFGIIFGIIDIFKVLVVQGVLDLGQVLQGIGMVLYVMVLGIGIVVVGMFFFNLFQECIECINDYLKVLMLCVCVGCLNLQL